MHARRGDVGVDDRLVPMSEVATRRRRCDEVGPRVPATDEWLDAHIDAQAHRCRGHRGYVLPARPTRPQPANSHERSRHTII
ncbi:hypothetical protein FRACA_10142 [Frankia canadensis]|uniref:Uncharacterized protein n=1 Tax=Frankia canadensis TaxID=1836972 RepID=A0A2I2KI92_9ACTN|nr:hypothetical protein FRACA_10142 [Frankia canadensis]SOU52672.1 hypothetical protein FRACA_10142 [Frankia canadensis]